MVAKRRKRGIRGHGRVDVERIGEAVGRPGIDPRAWVTLARTEAGSDARRFDADCGWIVDCLTYGGSAHGNSVPCRVASAWPGLAGYGEHRPPADDEEVVVLFPGGDPEEDPIAIGVVPNGDGGGPPEMVAGRSVVPEGETVLGGQIAATDCEFLKSPYARVEEHEGERHLKAKWVTIEASTALAGVRLGKPTATHPVARADNLVVLLGSLIDAVSAALAAGTLTAGAAGVLSGLAAWNSAATSLKGQLAQLQSPGVVVP